MTELPFSSWNALADGRAQEPAPQPHPDPDTRQGLAPVRLQHLLELAGPQTAILFLAQLEDDLKAVERGLSQTIVGPDWAGLRGQTHVLIALAGTVGAERLHQATEALNLLARQHDLQGLGDARVLVAIELNRLVHLLRQMGDSLTGSA